MPICIAASTTSLTLIHTVASTTSLTPIYTAASSVALPIYMLAMLGIHILIEGMSKAQRYSFTSLDLVLPAAAILGLTPICMVASRTNLLPIYIDASRAGFTPIPICTLAMLNIYMLIKGVSKAQHFSFTPLNPITSVAAILWP